MCPDMICGKCFYCTHIQGYSWCSKSQCYGNSFTSAKWPHLLGGWAEYMYFKPGTFFYKVPDAVPPRVAVLAELMACAASLDKLRDFSSYSIEDSPRVTPWSYSVLVHLGYFMSSSWE